MCETLGWASAGPSARPGALRQRPMLFLGSFGLAPICSENGATDGIGWLCEPSALHLFCWPALLCTSGASSNPRVSDVGLGPRNSSRCQNGAANGIGWASPKRLTPVLLHRPSPRCALRRTSFSSRFSKNGAANGIGEPMARPCGLTLKRAPSPLTLFAPSNPLRGSSSRCVTNLKGEFCYQFW